jgi:lysozyme
MTTQTQSSFDTPDPTRVLGLSTSQYTGIVDWQKAAAAGIKFAIIKAAQGLNTARFFKENYAGAKAAGVLVGAYMWLYKPTVWLSAGGQGRAFANILKDYPLDLPAFIDFEWNSQKPKDNPYTDALWGALYPLQQAYSGRIGIYTAPGYWKEYGLTTPIWSGYPLWLAQYNQGFADPLAPWKTYTFLQWSEKGRGVDYGVPTSGEIDCELNYWNGTLQALYDYCGKSNPNPEPTVTSVNVVVGYSDGSQKTFANPNSVTLIDGDGNKWSYSK